MLTSTIWSCLNPSFTASGDDEEDWQFPDFIWLGVHNASHCLSIRILPTGLAATRLHILIGPHSVLLTILPCAEGTVRLVGGGDEREGRLEVCRHGLYGTVCNTSWTMDNTHVVCNQLGFSAKGKSIILALLTLSLLFSTSCICYSLKTHFISDILTCCSGPLQKTKNDMW